MLSIAGFFKKIQNKHTKELYLRNTIQATIKKYIGVELPLESISVKSDTISLEGISQAARSQVFIKKQLILDEINKDIRPKIISNIR